MTRICGVCLLHRTQLVGSYNLNCANFDSEMPHLIADV